MYHGAVAARLRSQLALKLFLLVVLNLFVYAPYIFLQHHQFFPVTAVPSTALDRMIPFWDQAVWVYLSIYLLMPIGPFLMTDRKQLFSYASGIILISVIANIVFIFWPTICPRPTVEGTTVAYKLLTVVDMPLHAIPSLHAAFAVYSALCGNLVIRELGGRAIWRVAVWIWAILILYATLATKQHMLADIVVGSALGVGTYFCVFGDRVFISRMSLLVQSAFGSRNKPNSAKP